MSVLLRPSVLVSPNLFLFFFFQAEDGIRDLIVTGVQTCALPILRWGLLLKPLGEVSFKRLNSASAVGWMLLMLLPLRLGEFARPLLIARPPAGGGQQLRRSGALASVVVGRIVDGIALGPLRVISLRLLGQAASADYVQ